MGPDRRVNLADKCRKCLLERRARTLYLAIVVVVFVLLLHPTFAERVLSVAERYKSVLVTLTGLYLRKED